MLDKKVDSKTRQNLLKVLFIDNYSNYFKHKDETIKEYLLIINESKYYVFTTKRSYREEIHINILGIVKGNIGETAAQKDKFKSTFFSEYEKLKIMSILYKVFHFEDSEYVNNFLHYPEEKELFFNRAIFKNLNNPNGIL